MNRKPLVALLILLLLLTPFASAFSPLALSRVDFTSNDPDLNKPVWLLTVVENGNEATAIGTIDNTAIERDDGATAKNDITIAIENTKNTCEYPLQNIGSSIKRIDAISVSGFNVVTQCSGTPGCFASYQYVFGGGYLFIGTQVAKETPPGTSATIIESKLKATVGSETVTGTISSLNQRSVILGSRVAATWNGNLVSGDQCPQPTDSGVTAVKGSQGYVITSKSAMAEYLSARSNFDACLGNVPTTALDKDERISACAAAHNAKVNAALQRTSITPWNAAPIATDSQGSGKVTITLPNLIQYPVITMRVDASWLGINIPVGMPEIINTETTPFTEGSNGNIRVTVKNIGDARASFEVSATCTGAASQVGTARTIALDSQAVGTVDIPLTGDAGTKSETFECKINARDLNKATNQDTATVVGTVNPLALCTPGQARCVENAIEACNAQGTAYVKSEVCTNGCTITNGLPVCIDQTSCEKPSDCDDDDITTIDQCVGVVDKQCKHTPVAFGNTDLVKWAKILIPALLLIVCIALGLGYSPWFHIGTAITAFVLVFNVFAIVGGGLAAWLFLASLVLVLAGIGIFEFLPQYGILGIVLGVIAFLVDLALVLT